ncbi:MAG: tetratricopeptide repeat protein [Verrucomicrobiales bacterium]|nr:tetratricopeptide repeat protein [Verrucomicrobiales bacterium]
MAADFETMRGSVFTFLFFASFLHAQDPLPIDPLWKSDAFRKAFTGSYGIDARIEPKVTTEEKSVLDAVAGELANGDRAAAIAKLTASSLLEKSPALLFAVGNLEFEEGKIDEAIGRFDAALKLYPNFRDAHRNLALALVQKNETAKAEPHLTRAIELGAQDGLTLGLLGYVHANAGRGQAALQAYRLAQLTMPSEPQWKLGEAHALLSLDEPKAAASIFGEILEQRPDDAGIWMNQADAFSKLDQPENAIANLELVRRLGKLGPAETISLGHLFLNESLPEAALVCYEGAISAGKPAPLAKALDALEYLALFRRWEEAELIASKISGSESYSGPLGETQNRSRFDRARALLELERGNAEAGAKLVEAILERDPLDALAQILLAQFRVREGKVEEGILLLEQAATQPEHEAEVLRIHGQILVNRGDFKEAVELLERVLELEPEDAGLREYVEAVRDLQ